MIFSVLLLTATLVVIINGKIGPNINNQKNIYEYQGSPHKRCHIVGDFDHEKEQLDDFYYYMLYFEGDTSDFFTTRNRPPCRTKAEIEV